ncbi:hypothetical protein [Rhizobium leguminosarum]|uniref:hypothetical protein n=1 Tax=Rhizobium leguminosarum TaxID=384 RepID=UPI001FE08E6F|nr:hypothetical protein [Rhizobium leguminosarum]
MPESFAAATIAPSTAPIASAVAVTASVIKVAAMSSAPHPVEPKPSSSKLAISSVPRPWQCFAD